MALQWYGPFYNEVYEASSIPGIAISARDSNDWPVHLSVEPGANADLLENYYNVLRIKPALWEGSSGYEAHFTADNLYTAKIKATVIDPRTGGVAYTAYQTYSFRALDSKPVGFDGETVIDTYIDEGLSSGADVPDAYYRPIVFYKNYVSDGAGYGTLKLVDDAGGRFKLEQDGDGHYHMRVADGARLDYQDYIAGGRERYKVAFELTDGTTTYSKVGYIGLNNVAGGLTGDVSAEVAARGAYTLTAADLGAERAGANPTFVVSNPTGGNVVLAGSATPVTSFTAADIAAGKVQFVPSGGLARASFDVAAQDGYGTTASKTFSLNVSNQAPRDMIYVGPYGDSTTLIYNEESFTGWGLRVTDPEGETGTTGLKWSIVGGADRDAFTIRETGIGGGSFEFKTIQDFEAPKDANRDNRYELVVRVTDSYGASLDKAWTVAVNNLPEVTVAEGAARGTVVFGGVPDPFAGTEFAGGPFSMKYALFPGEDRFTIDRNTGAIRVAAGFKLDYEQASTVFLPIKRSIISPELDLGSDSRGFLIHLRDVRNETVSGDGKDNTLVGGKGNDTFFGLGGSDILNGGNGRNRLDGGAGDDRLIGGRNEDTYVVDSLKDFVSEKTGGGRDTVEASISYDLDAQARAKLLVGAVEDLTLLEGRNAIKATGNALANTLKGNSNANTLDGKGGIDTMQGFKGGDTYIVDNARDSVIEAARGGYDTVMTSVSYALAAKQEIEVLRTVNPGSKTKINLTGNEFGQTLQGNEGANRLDGKGGADTLQGFGGADTFVFSLKPGGIDRIVGFSHADDTIELARSAFGKLSAGKLAEDAFKDLGVKGAHLEADDRILYDHRSGVLSYDADGLGKTAAVQFALVVNPSKAVVDHTDFFIV